MGVDFDSEEWRNQFMGTGASADLADRLVQRTQAALSPQANASLVNPAAVNAAIFAAVQETQSLEPDLFDHLPQPTQPLPPAPKAKSSDHKLVVSRLDRVSRRGRKPAPIDAKPPTAQQQDLFELSMEIEKKNAAESEEDRGFIATSMIYASLPHSEIESGIFKRKNGEITLSIMNDPEIGLPFGKIPRIITAFLCTEAKRYATTRGRTVHLGESQAQFMAKLGMNSNGGKRGDIGRVSDQAYRLFTSTIQLRGEPNKAQKHWRKVDISPQGMLLWDPQKPDEKSPWESTLTLGEAFFEDCITHSVPIDMRVIRKFRSPLAIDIYIWLTYRFNSIKYATPVTWPQLKWQFGSNYPDTQQGLYDFKSNFKGQLRNVLTVYSDAKVDVHQEALILLPSQPHVLPVSKE